MPCTNVRIYYKNKATMFLKGETILTLNDDSSIVLSTMQSGSNSMWPEVQLNPVLYPRSVAAIQCRSQCRRADLFSNLD